jgi:hypothetical protein
MKKKRARAWWKLQCVRFFLMVGQMFRCSFIFSLYLFLPWLVNCQQFFTLSVNESPEDQFDFFYEMKTNNTSLTSIPNYKIIQEEIRKYCTTNTWVSSSSSQCQSALTIELLVKLSKMTGQASPWLINDVVRASFSSDLINLICFTKKLNLRFETETECSKHLEKDIRIKKAWLSLYDVLPLREHMLQNNLIVLENWNDVIEGHSFGFYDKIKKLSKLADDPRVTTICEIGYNFGHSVGSLLHSSLLSHITLSCLPSPLLSSPPSLPPSVSRPSIG